MPRTNLEFTPCLKPSVAKKFRTLSDLAIERHKRKLVRAGQAKGESAGALSQNKRVFCGKDDSGNIISMSKREFERLTWRI